MLTKIVNYNDGAIRRQKNFDDGFSHFCTIPACDGLTDGRTELLYQYRPLHPCGYAIRSVVYCCESSRRCFFFVRLISLLARTTAFISVWTTEQTDRQTDRQLRMTRSKPCPTSLITCQTASMLYTTSPTAFSEAEHYTTEAGRKIIQQYNPPSYRKQRCARVYLADLAIN